MSAYLNTRVSLHANRLWQAADFDALLNSANDGIPAVLSEHGLSHLAAGFQGDAAPSLEQRVIAQTLDETEILIRPLRGAERDFLTYWTARFEINNVKTLLRGKMTGDRPAQLLARMTPMGRFTRLDNEALAHTEDTGELLLRLEAGPYADIVHQARRAFEQHRDPFSLDAALDRSYYEGLLERARTVSLESEPQRESPLALVASLIDSTNAIWLLRYRFNYKLPPAQVYYLLITPKHAEPALRLDSRRLRELAGLDDQASVLHALAEHYPLPIRAGLASATDIPSAMFVLEETTAELAGTILKSRTAPALSRSVAYLTLRERDLRAVRAVLRGRHLGLASATIRQALQRDTQRRM